MQCKECLLYWNQGIVYCTCRHLVKESEANRGATQCTLDFLSIQNHVIRRDDLMAIDMGKLQNKENIMLPIISERDASRGFFKGIHDRFLNDPEFRTSQLEHDRTEDGRACAKKFSYHMTQAEYFRYRKNWWISLGNSGRSGPLKDRSDINDALTTLNRLHQESGERQLRPMPFWKYQHWHQSSSSSSSWWQWSDSWWSSQ